MVLNISGAGLFLPFVNIAVTKGPGRRVGKTARHQQATDTTSGHPLFALDLPLHRLLENRHVFAQPVYLFRVVPHELAERRELDPAKLGSARKQPP